MATLALRLSLRIQYNSYYALVCIAMTTTFQWLISVKKDLVRLRVGAADVQHGHAAFTSTLAVTPVFEHLPAVLADAAFRVHVQVLDQDEVVVF